MSALAKPWAIADASRFRFDATRRAAFDPTRSPGRARLLLAVLLMASLASGCPDDASEPVAPPAESTRALDRYNVFVILLDSLRADHVEPYGASHVQTPRLSELAKQGVTFTNARSNSSWTRPAVASLLTSLSPSSHGVQDMRDRLSMEIMTLPRILKRLGYRTLAVTSNVIVSRPFGFARGFDVMHPHYNLLRTQWPEEFPTPEARAGYIWERYVEPSLTEHPEQPFMVYLHEVDPHSPFEVGAPWDRLYTDESRPDLSYDLPTIRAIRENPDAADPTEIDYFHALYRSEITFMDRYVGWMIDRLEREGLAERTLVVVLSDHGEEFMDHRSVGHGHALHEELLRVPLLLRLPGVLAEGLRIDGDAQLLDLPPTILDLIGAPIPEWMEGKSLLPLSTLARVPPASAGSADADPPRPSFASSIGPRHSSVVLGDWKLIITHPDPAGGAVNHQLFDLSRDPRETQNLWTRESVVGQKLDQLLREKLATPRHASLGPTRAVAPESLEPNEMQSLRALGYVE